MFQDGVAEVAIPQQQASERRNLPDVLETDIAQKFGVNYLQLTQFSQLDEMFYSRICDISILQKQFSQGSEFRNMFQYIIAGSRLDQLEGLGTWEEK